MLEELEFVKILEISYYKLFTLLSIHYSFNSVLSQNVIGCDFMMIVWL